MHLISTITATAVLALTASGAVVESRLPRLGAFGVSQTPGCPIQNPVISEWAEGSESSQCHTFYNNAVYTTVDVYYWDPQCLLTLFQTTNCSDPGIVSGLGCWEPEGGIAGFTVTCPYKT